MNRPVLLPLTSRRRPLPPEAALYMAGIAEQIGNECPHDWVMHLPPRRELPADLSHFTFTMALPLRMTCAHCPAVVTIRKDEDGEIRLHGTRLGGQAK